MTHKESITTTEYTFTAVFEPTRDGGYVVTFPAIYNLATQGETLEEAREMATDCLRCYLERLQKDGRRLPISEDVRRNTRREPIIVKLSMA